MGLSKATDVLLVCMLVFRICATSLAAPAAEKDASSANRLNPEIQPATQAAPDALANTIRLERRRFYAANSRWAETRRQNGGVFYEWADEERDRYYGLLVQNHLVRFMRDYQLTPEQIETVRRRLKEQKRAQMAFLKPRLAKLIKMKEEADRQAQENWDPDEDKARRREIMIEMGSLMKESPLHFRNVTPEIEKLLPPAQVKQVQERQEEQRKRMRMGLQARARQIGRPGAPQDIYLGSLERMAENPFGVWNQYADMYSRCYRLDAKQAQNAENISAKYQDRRREHYQDHAADYAAADRMQDDRLRNEQLDHLDKPLLGMFEAMRKDLDAVPTEDQKAAAQARHKQAVERLEDSFLPIDVDPLDSGLK